MTILVTGATGTVGREVVRALQTLEQPVRVSSTDPDRAKQLLAASGLKVDDAVRLEFGDAQSYSAAFTGVDKVFLMRPPQTTAIKKEMLPALEAARTEGVQQIVFMSLQGAEKNPVVPHRQVERHLETSAFDYTLLRPSFFMQNLAGVHAEDIRAYNEIFVPAGRGRTSFIDARDIGAVAAKVLTEAGHTRRAYELTGSVALTYAEVAQLFSDVLGREIRYTSPDPLAFYRRMRSRGLTRGYILVMAALYSACRFGLAAHTTDDTRSLLGREPISITQFAADYRDVFTAA